ncbi:MAG: hypothetical protein M0R51_11350 [Clostridia bacterium]|jgi:hypothetical protein|nr:hypothetical protein [Clostridia bacterium]
MSYAIEILKEELDLLKSNVAWVEDTESTRYYTDDDESDLIQWKEQISELEEAIRRLE